jgi:hypothetical protein
MTVPWYRYIALLPYDEFVGTNDLETARKLANVMECEVIDCLRGEFFGAGGENTVSIREATPEDYE